MEHELLNRQQAIEELHDIMFDLFFCIHRTGKPSVPVCIGAMGIGKTFFMHNAMRQLASFVKTKIKKIKTDRPTNAKTLLKQLQQFLGALEQHLVELRVSFGNGTPFTAGPDASDKYQALRGLCARMLASYCHPNAAKLAADALRIRAYGELFATAQADGLLGSVVSAIVEHRCRQQNIDAATPCIVFLCVDEIQHTLQGGLDGKTRRHYLRPVLEAVGGLVQKVPLVAREQQMQAPSKP